MKTLKWILLSAGLLLSVFSASVFAQETAPASASFVTVERFVGNCEYRVGNGEWKMIADTEVKIPVNAEIRLKSAEDSLDLVLPGGKPVTITGVTTKKMADIIAANSPQRAAGKTLTVGIIVGSGQIKNAAGEWVALKYGDPVAESSEVRVIGKKDNMELIFPDGSVLNVMGMTTVRVKDILRPRETKTASLVELIAGRIFARVKPSSSQDFRVETATAVAAVRGTKFGVSYNTALGGQVLVTEGSVAVGDPEGKFDPVLLQPGFMSQIPAMAGTAPSQPQAIPPALAQEFDPEYNPAPAATPVRNPGSVDVPPVATPAPQETPSSGAAAPQGSGLPKSGSDECSKDGMNWSISSENIDGGVWNKVLLSPTFSIGGFTMSLYIPLYFKNVDDIFKPSASNWYNYSEWDFTSWQDALHDVLLKIRYLQYTNQNLLVKVGSIPDMTLGHGSLVNNYANDLQFPSVRKVGFQFNMDFGNLGFESMMGDVFETKLMAGRLYYRPFYGTGLIGKLGVGLSGFVDFSPLYTDTNKVFGYGFDLDVPILTIPVFSLTMFADADTLGYIADTNSLMAQGMGVFAGFKGTLLIVDYRAEYRYLQGGFIPNYIDRFYDVYKGDRYLQLVGKTYPDFNGVLVYAGKSFEGIGNIGLSYEHYIPMTASTNTFNMFHMEANLSKCLFKKAYGSITYDRMNFEFTKLFTDFLGEGALITTKIFYQITEGAYVGMTYKKYFELNTATGQVEEKNTYSLTTEMGF